MKWVFISHKMPFFIVTTVKTSNLTYVDLIQFFHMHILRRRGRSDEYTLGIPMLGYVTQCNMNKHECTTNSHIYPRWNTLRLRITTECGMMSHSNHIFIKKLFRKVWRICHSCEIKLYVITVDKPGSNSCHKAHKHSFLF
jgi:hypothetical protein